MRNGPNPRVACSCPSRGAWRSLRHQHRSFSGIRNDGKVHTLPGNLYGFAFAIQPQVQPLVMFVARTSTTRFIVRDDMAGLAVPRLIERDHAMLSGPRSDLTLHLSIPLARNIAEEGIPKNCANYQRGWILGSHLPVPSTGWRRRWCRCASGDAGGGQRGGE